ncbi:MAG: transporter substrate-binding domain-containing protein [Verrucomicrobia bacterium]|nr:transporter substrate-binding domain-containing protein [Verrucomicrobiota bacterium]MDE3047967.1 transporter substrate-binding domain-containing protein [Verrucomicrobiota bacterium]
MRFLRLFLLALGFCSCGSNPGGFRIGYDPDWYPSDFGPQTSYVNGYTAEMLLEMAHLSGMRFELVRANGGSLLEGLQAKKYDAVLTTLPPYEYNLAKYDFSENFLDLGPVLIAPLQAEKNSLEKLEGDLVGIITNDPAALILAKHPAIIIRQYPSVPALLDAVAQGEIQGALLAYIPAVNYVSDLYSGILHIVGKPLTHQGIHLVGAKGGLDAFNRNLASLRKKSVLEKLKQKWELAPPT